MYHNNFLSIIDLLYEIVFSNFLIKKKRLKSFKDCLLIYQSQGH